MPARIAGIAVAALALGGAVASTAGATARLIDVRAVAATQITAIAAEAGPPVVVPGRLPVDASGRIVASGGSRGARGYAIVLGAPGCNGADACSVATFSADRRATAAGPVRVALVRGVEGRFTPMSCGASCTRPAIAFRLGGVAYTLEVVPIGPGHRAQLVRLANQAIVAARPAPRPANTPTPRQKSVCSASGDTCTAIYLRGTSIVIRRGYAARYVPKERLCLRYPGMQVSCRTVPVRRVGKAWQSQAVFPMQDPGPYQVVGTKGARIVAGT